MSYLRLPRLQFGGLFFTNPNTVNNYWTSYNPMVQLADAQGQYLSRAAGGGPSGWNAIGVAQLWLAECRVLGAVDASGAPVDDDPVLGAAVETPSPQTPKKGPDGFYDIAKLVDLDPLQQGRSRGYGLRVFVTLPGGGGFSGALTVPELRYMYPRIPLRGGSWTAVGNWQGVVVEPEWQGDVSSSPFLEAFRDACPHGVSFKIAMDLHQNNPANRFTAGDMFYYGRVLGSMGPVEPGELAQVVPGRMLAQPPTSRPAAESAVLAAEGAPAVLERLRGVIGQTLDDRAAAESAAVVTATETATTEATETAGLETEAEPAPPLHPWNAAFAQVTEHDGRSILHLDLGFAILLAVDRENGENVVLGKFETDSGIRVGVADGSGGVTPLTHGAVSFDYTFLDSQSKRCFLVNNGGVVDVPLEDHEAALVASRPLVVTRDGATVLAEAADGLFMDLSHVSLRLYAGKRRKIGLMARRFGRPIVNEKPVRWTIFDMNGRPIRGDEIAIEWLAPTNEHGVAVLQVKATGETPVIPPSRQPLDSLMYFAGLADASGRPIGDGSAGLSVLLWPPFEIPARITWQRDVGPLLAAYARLYPGMKDRLDIGDETTVKGFAAAMHDRMSRRFNDPAYMPVTRDLSPPKVKMILQWLEQFV